MFIVKDQRKIAEILYDDGDDRVSLKLGRREAEFAGRTDVLLEPSTGSKLRECRSLSLYGNKLEALTHVETLAAHARALQELNVRRVAVSGVHVGASCRLSVPGAFGARAVQLD
jgi:hypothetical protein